MVQEQKNVTYYPHPTDNMWNAEAGKLIPYLFGKGADIGSSNRSIFTTDVRVDIDPERHPDILCSGDKLPFEDEEFDYVYGIHSFEHFPDQEKLLKEWRRVVKKGGIVAIVHPDLEFTKEQKPLDQNMDKNPYNKHFYERTYQQWLDWFSTLEDLGLKIIDSGVACGRWSFYVIMKRVIAFH